MSNWREEIRVLPCGCKIGRSANGLWFYDFICEKHVKEVQENGHYSYDKALKMTEDLNKKLKEEETKEKAEKKAESFEDETAPEY